MNRVPGLPSIRPSRPGDVPAIIAFMEGSWARTYAPIIGEGACRDLSLKSDLPAKFLAEIAEPDGLSLVAVETNGAIAGHAGGRIRAADRVCFIDRLHVAPEFQGSGLAPALLRRVAEAVAGQCDAIELSVLHGNERAAAFYRKCGFRELGERDGLAGVPVTVLRLDLSADQNS